MKYRNKKTGKIVDAEQFSHESIMAKMSHITVSIKTDKGAIVNIKAGDWVVKQDEKTYVVREANFSKLYERIES